MTTAGTEGVQLLRSEIRCDDLSGDPYGTAMRYWFAIAESLSRAGEDIPDPWEFRPSLLSGISAESLDIVMWDWFSGGEVTPDDLRFYGNVLRRYVDLCKREGRDY